MGEVVPSRTSPTLLPPSPRTVLSLSCFKVLQCIEVTSDIQHTKPQERASCKYICFMLCIWMCWMSYQKQKFSSSSPTFYTKWQLLQFQVNFFRIYSYMYMHMLFQAQANIASPVGMQHRAKKNTIHQVTTMLATFKKSCFQVLTTC